MYKKCVGNLSVSAICHLFITKRCCQSPRACGCGSHNSITQPAAGQIDTSYMRWICARARALFHPRSGCSQSRAQQPISEELARVFISRFKTTLLPVPECEYRYSRIQYWHRLGWSHFLYAALAEKNKICFCSAIDMPSTQGPNLICWYSRIFWLHNVINWQ